MNEMIVEAHERGKVVYEDCGDKSLIDLFTKRFQPKKKIFKQSCSDVQQPQQVVKHTKTPIFRQIKTNWWYGLLYTSRKGDVMYDSGTTWTTVTLLTGNFSYGDISGFIQQQLESNKHSKVSIEVKIVRLLFRVLVTLETSYQVYLQTGVFADLLGLDKDIVTVTSYGTKSPDMKISVDNISIHKRHSW